MALTYQSPGVYVEEIPPAVRPIAGVSTSIAGFIGVMDESFPQPLEQVSLGMGDGTTSAFNLPSSVVPRNASEFDPTKYCVWVDGALQPKTEVTLAPVNANGTIKSWVANFTTPPGRGAKIALVPICTAIPPGQAVPCTNFTDFKTSFGDFSGNYTQGDYNPTGSSTTVSGILHDRLVQAVYGFFNNGGSVCYVMRFAAESDIGKPNALINFESIDEIAIVAVPGLVQLDTCAAIIAHCTKTQNRFAIFDGPLEVPVTPASPPGAGGLDLSTLDASSPNNVLPPYTDLAAYYYPWLLVLDPVSNVQTFAPPSGHIAGIYARVDNNRGVFKAPANEPVLGALGLPYQITRSEQELLNPQGVNCIRNLNGNVTVWGARTLGGEHNDIRYINVRRTLLFLETSIRDGTQWAVFEPNDQTLWGNITRDVTAFLTSVWRAGGLFGTTAQQAFYVKCDAETNPDSQIALGQVVTEVGVAIVRPAEFVIFRISQYTAPTS